jgi:hypothetical protein
MQTLMKEVLIERATIQLFSVRYLAMKLHRSPETIRFWEFHKIIPKPLIKTKEGRRWYTQEEVDLYIRLAEEEQIKNGKKFANFTSRAFGEIKLLADALERRVIESRNF